MAASRRSPLTWGWGSCCRECVMSAIAVDIDVLGYPDLPANGARSFVADLRAQGRDVVIVTSDEPSEARDWLVTHDFPEQHAQRELPPVGAFLHRMALEPT